MIYKALIFDLDGTAIDTKQEALPTQATINAVKEAQVIIPVSIATGRLFYNAGKVISALGIKSPCIFAGGSQIKDPITQRVLWSKEMSTFQVQEIISIGKRFPYKFYFSEDQRLYAPAEKKAQPEMIAYLMDVPKDKTDALVSLFQSIDDIAVHPTGSWEKDCWDIHITHKEATKKQAVMHLLSLLNVKREEVMVVGDTGNDLPLFESAGLKVAMGNATEELKNEADFITEDVLHDGLACAIRKFIL